MAGDGGTVRRPADGQELGSREKLGLGLESREARGAPLTTQGGPWRQGGARGGHGDDVLVAAVFPLSPQEEEGEGETDRWVPLSGFYPFLFFQKFQGVSGNCFRPLSTL